MNTEGKHKTLIGLVAFTVMTGSMTAHAALTSVTQDGDLLVSDSTLNVTWADVAPPTALTWPAAQAWAAGLDTMVNTNSTIGYGGYTNWRLATGDGTQSHSPVNSANELGSLFFTELLNTPGSPVTNTSPFKNLSTNANTVYWSSSTGGGASAGSAWVFYPGYGAQVYEPETIYYDALAVRSGFTAVPVPAAAWLLGSGLMGLLGLRRRKAATLALRSSG
jgi:hypothetical protein